MLTYIFIVIMIRIDFIFNFTNFSVVVFWTKLLTLGILFSTELTTVVVAMLMILCILFLVSFISALRLVVVANLVY